MPIAVQELKYTEILRLNKELGDSMPGERYKVTVLSNTITSQLNEIFEYCLRSGNINASVSSGDYDNIVQDSARFSGSDLVVIFWEAANIVDGLQYKANTMDENETDSLIAKVCSEIDFVLGNLRNTSLVILNKFSSLIFNHELIRQNNFDRICEKLNRYLEQKKASNMLLIDIDKILAKISIPRSVDFRYYYSSKALYSTEFLKTYSAFVSPAVASVKGRSKKALVFDCDNTLWKGILGEDGSEKIEMSGKTKGGVVFEEVQHLAVELSKKGILIGLCSKNNGQDVDDILDRHPDVTLRKDNITVRKVNWDDKASNLRKIAAELNIGLDSIVFVDDSDFETGLIKEQVPEIEVIKVPSALYEYPETIRRSMRFFYSLSETDEDRKRAEMYRQQAERAVGQSAFSDMESYLVSLGLEVTIYKNPADLVSRISQLTQKTNQFNLTTRRYTETDISRFIEGNGHMVLAFAVKDKYGDSGITGVAIVELDGEKKIATLDSLLMSCRVIGRNIELAFFDHLIGELKKSGIKELTAAYHKTLKNEQVADFYDRVGMIRADGAATSNTANAANTANTAASATPDAQRKYRLPLSDYTGQNISYITIH